MTDIIDYNFLEYHGKSAKSFLQAMEEKFDFPMEPPIDIDKLAELLGVVVDEQVDFENLDTTGSISISNDVPKVWINPLENTYDPRRRFTLAHEIGHLLLHIDPKIGIREFIDTEKTFNRKESYWDTKEYQANNFAAQLLMPVELIQKHGRIIINEYKKQNNVAKVPVDAFVAKMAELFNVSKPSMKYRLKNVGAIK